MPRIGIPIAVAGEREHGCCPSSADRIQPFSSAPIKSFRFTVVPTRR